jgi:ribokinase
VVVLGSVNMDLVVRVDELPRPGDTVLGDRLLTFPGGKGANQAVAAARLGAGVRMLGRVGADAFGRRLLDGLRGDGVEVQGVAVDETEPTGAALIVVDRRGQNIITVAPGANAAVGEPEVENVRRTLSAGDVLVLQLEVPLSAVLAAIDAAHAAGARVILNAAPSAPLRGKALPDVDVLVVNEQECEDLGGPDAVSAREAVVETMGASGAMLYTASTTGLIEPRHVEAIDATAAGDAFVGTLAFALARGSEPRDAVQLANAAGAAAVTRLGAQPSLPYPADLNRLFGITLGNGAGTNA